jgi:hypothetical protein
MIIKDLTVSKELDMSEMSAVHGGDGLELGSGTVCIDVGPTLEDAAKEKGFGGVIIAAAGIFSSPIKPC